MCRSGIGDAHVRGQPAGVRELPGRRVLLGHLPAHRLDAAMVQATGRPWLRGGRAGDLSPYRGLPALCSSSTRRGSAADGPTRTRPPSSTSTTTSAPRSTGSRPTTVWRRRPLRDRALHRRPPGLPRRVRLARARHGALVPDRSARWETGQGRRRGIARARIGDPGRVAADFRQQRSAHAQRTAVRSSSARWRRRASTFAGACTTPSTPSAATSDRAMTRR